jgi:hypothetical protein
MTLKNHNRRINLGVDYWCPEDPTTLYLRGQAEVDPDRIAYFRDFCQSPENRVSTVRIDLHGYESFHEHMIPQIAESLGQLVHLKEITVRSYDPTDHIQRNMVQAILVATQHLVEDLGVTETHFGPDSAVRENCWSSVLRFCRKIRSLHVFGPNKSLLYTVLENLNDASLPSLDKFFFGYLSPEKYTEIENMHNLSRNLSNLLLLPTLRQLILVRVALTDDTWSQFIYALKQSRLTQLCLQVPLHRGLFDCEFPESLTDLYLMGSKKFDGFKARNFADFLAGPNNLHFVVLEDTDLSAAEITDILETKPGTVTVCVDRHSAKLQWKQSEIDRVARLLENDYKWTKLGRDWESPHPRSPFPWQEVDGWLALNRTGRAQVLEGKMDPAIFMQQHSDNVLENYLFLRRDALRLGLFQPQTEVSFDQES